MNDLLYRDLLAARQSRAQRFPLDEGIVKYGSPPVSPADNSGTMSMLQLVT
jgi:hypothetical protein